MYVVTGLRLLSMENETRPFSVYVNSFGAIARKLRRAAVRNPSDLRRLVTCEYYTHTHTQTSGYM